MARAVGRVGLVALVLGAVAALLWLAVAPAESADPGALWRVVRGLCVTDMRLTGHPAPCARVDLAKGYAVVNDISGGTQLLAVPTSRIPGIESPALLRADAPNYWQDAWDAKPLFERRAGRDVPREDLALAINSVDGRTQDQLHIHIDCVRRGIRRLLDKMQGRIGDHWADFDIGDVRRHYRAMRVEGADLGDRDPFKLLADDPRARADMGRETMAVIGTVFADGRPGFILLADQADWTRFDKGTAEDLMDHRCKILRDGT